MSFLQVRRCCREEPTPARRGRPEAPCCSSEDVQLLLLPRAHRQGQSAHASLGMSEVIFGGKKALGCQLRNRKRAGEGCWLEDWPRSLSAWGSLCPNCPRSQRMDSPGARWAQWPAGLPGWRPAAPAGQLQPAELSGVLLTPRGPPASEAQVSLAPMLEHRTQSTGTAPGL